VPSACGRSSSTAGSAPDVYLGVAQVVPPDGGVREQMVVMRRTPADRRFGAGARRRSGRRRHAAGSPARYPARDGGYMSRGVDLAVELLGKPRGSPWWSSQHGYGGSRRRDVVALVGQSVLVRPEERIESVVEGRVVSAHRVEQWMGCAPPPIGGDSRHSSRSANRKKATDRPSSAVSSSCRRHHVSRGTMVDTMRRNSSSRSRQR
jgi:hypothetical protein